MISLIDVCKDYPTSSGLRRVLSNVSFTVQKGERIGILGRNGVGKSTLVRLISGVEHPSSGQIVRNMSVSWPLAFSGGFQGSLTGLDNLRFICRVYGADFKKALDFVEDFSELGGYIKEPIKHYSSGMRARLAFGISMAIDFDCYLVDEVIAVGDAKFKEKCREELFERKNGKSIILVSHSDAYVKQFCDRVCVLGKGQSLNFDDKHEGLAYYQSTMNLKK